MPGKNNRDEDRKADNKRDHLIFLICILLAAGFWFLIKLSDSYSVSYRLKIKYTHVPAGKLITAIDDSSTIVHFQSIGYNLLDLMLHRKLDSLTINLSECNIRRQNGNVYAISTSGLRENVAQALAVNDRDLEFAKPELRFNMERLHKRAVKISAMLDLGFKSQFNLYNYKVVPATITIYGPRQILDTLKVLRTASVHLENLDGNQKVSVAIQNPYPRLLKLFPPKVHIDLNVERYTEQRIQIPIDVSAVRPEIRTFPTTVSVNFNVFIRDYEKIHAAQFKIIPNDKNIDLRKVKTLRLELVSSPKEISNVRIVPPEVEFIIVN
jgi:hypothetical protein